MNLATRLASIRRKRPVATADDIRNVFGEYHNVLHWLAAFLVGDDRVAEACIVDACTIAQNQTPTFHEWLVQWAARATVRCAVQRQRARILELASEYDDSEAVQVEYPPLSPEYIQLLVKDSELIHGRLDVLCRLVLVLRGIAQDSFDKVATQLGISRSSVTQAYWAAFDTLEGGLLRDA